MLKKMLSVLLCAVQILVAGSLMAGCGKREKQLVYFLNFKPESAKTYEQIAKDYEKETGIRVKVVTAAANTYEQTLKSEVAKSQAPTIFQINGPVGYQSWKDYCLDLRGSSVYSLLSDSSLAIRDGEKVVGIPYAVEGYGILYNNEIMKRYFALPDRRSSLNDASQIRSFSELKTVVEDMTAHKEQLGIEGVFGSTSLASGEDWRWQTHLANVPFYEEFREDAPSAETVVTATNAKTVEFRYSEAFRSLFDLYTDNSVTQKTLLGSKSVEDSMAEFALSRCAMIQNGTWAWSQIANVSGNTVSSDEVGMLPLYMGLPGEESMGLCIGTENYLAINARVSEEKQQASLDFLDWLFSSETGKRYVREELRFITPFSSFADGEQPTDPLSEQMLSSMKNPDTHSIPWTFTGFPGEAFKKAFGNALLEYVQGSLSFDEVKNTVIVQWERERNR